MEKESLVNHKKELIDKYTKNLQELEKKEAENALEFDLRLSNQIDNIKEIIKQKQAELSELEEGDEATVRVAPYPLQKYEDFIITFAEEITMWNKNPTHYEKLMLSSLRRATNASIVFIARYIDGDWNLTANDNSREKEIKSKYIRSGALNYVLNLKSADGISQNGLFLEDIPGQKSSLLFAYTKNNSEILVFDEINEILIYDKAFELILSTIVNCTDCLKSPLSSEELEMLIYNNLKRNFGYVSDAMYNRQYYLFNQNLERMTIEFEPIIFLSPDAPSIFGWEALARNPDLPKGEKGAPSELFETAETWGVRFQLQVDLYFLKKAIDTYVIESDNEKLKSSQKERVYRRKHTILPLSVNVNPSSLLRSRYHETIRNISSQGNMPLNKLYLEISEKAPIPAPDDWDGKQNVIGAFRDKLFFYRDLDIHFSVDDFGIGYASSSRVSRLGPAFVKVDRDALLDNYGNFTLEFVVGLARRMPGEIRVILEGFDEDSVYSLRKIYGMGIRYVQGHKFGLSRSNIDDRLSKSYVEEIKMQLSER